VTAVIGADRNRVPSGVAAGTACNLRSCLGLDQPIDLRGYLCAVNGAVRHVLAKAVLDGRCGHGQVTGS
jgi:hypothetical protein